MSTPADVALALRRHYLITYCIAYQRSILVRDTVKGHTAAYPLSALPLKSTAKHVCRWLSENRLPHRRLHRDNRPNP